MGLITLLVAIALTVLYFGRSLDKKPEQLVKITNLMMAHIDMIAKWAGIYGLVAIVLTLLMSYTLGDMLVRLANNVVICLMVLPFVFGKMTEKYEGKINVAIMDEVKNLVGKISSNEKTMSYIGTVSAAALFFTLFK